MALTEIEQAVEMTAHCRTVEHDWRQPKEARWTALLWCNAIGECVMGVGPQAWAAVQAAHAEKARHEPEQEGSGTPSAMPVEDNAPVTTFLQRFGDAMERLCEGSRPSDALMVAWLDPALDDFGLQEFAIEHGPEWAQGIAVIDAARLLAEQPAEGEDHEPAP